MQRLRLVLIVISYSSFGQIWILFLDIHLHTFVISFLQSLALVALCRGYNFLTGLYRCLLGAQYNLRISVFGQEVG